MIFYEKEDYLTNENINTWSEEAGEQYLLKAGKNACSKTKASIAVEEVLLAFRETFGTESKCSIRGRKSFGSIFYIIMQKGPEINPVAPDEDMQLSYNILSRLNIKPKYTYNTGSRTNCVSIPTEKKPQKHKTWFLMVGAVLLAVFLYLILHAFAPSSTSYLYEEFSKPVFEKMTAVITAIATFLVLFSVINGITGLNDVASFGAIGKNVCKEMGIVYGFAAAVLALFSLLAYPLSKGTSTQNGSILKQITSLVLDIIPGNFVLPFSTDNHLQVISIAIFVGVVMLILKNHISKLKAIIEELSELVNKMMAIACKLIPLMVFFGIFNLLCGSEIKDFVKIYKMVILFLTINFIVIAFEIIYTRIVTKAPLGVVLKKTIPALLINLTTSSNAIALPEHMNSCKNKFGMNEKMVDFALPLSIVVYMPCGVAFLGLTAISLADISGIALDFSTFIRIILVAVVLAIATPPIPGSAFAIMPILFTTCGIPGSVYPIAVLLGTFVAYLCPAFNGFCIQLTLLTTAVKMNQVDMELLKKP